MQYHNYHFFETNKKTSESEFNEYIVVQDKLA